MATTSSININVDVLHSEFSKINDYISELDDYINKIKSIMEDISKCWDDSAHSNVFVPKMEVFLEELGNIEKQVQSHRDYICGYIEAHTTLDTVFLAKKMELE